MKETLNLPPVTLLANNVHLTYTVYVNREANSRNPFGGRQRKTNFEALRGISLHARQGDFIGLIGRNGSGKSTLLRVLAGLETPSSGSVLATAKPQLLGVDAALISNLSGLDNIRLGLLAMGLTPEEAEERRDRIIDLASIGDAIYRPMKTYSSGMRARLRFAISVAANPEILMIDEALATGDSAIAARSRQAMQDLIGRAGTGFLVSHSPRVIESMCNRAVWIDQGQVIMDGEVEETTKTYRKFMWNLSRKGEEEALIAREGYRQSYEERRKFLFETPVTLSRGTDDAEATEELE